MSSEQHQPFDLIVIGGGQAGPFLAAQEAKRGERVAVIEADLLGGTCINRGCTPTKTLRKSARVAHLARRAHEFGVVTGPVEVDFRAAISRMNERVEQSRSGLEQWLGALEGLELHHAKGRLAGRTDDGFIVMAGEQRLVGRRVVLNVGTHSFFPAIDGLNEESCVDSEGLLKLDELPPQLLVLGGGYIGLEMGQIFRRLGSEVTVLETNARIVGREDPDVSAALTEALRAEGIDIRTAVSVTSVRGKFGAVSVVLDTGDQIHGTVVLAATGRRPNTSDLGLETVGLEATARGMIETNGRLETAIDGIWALGDINGRGAFTHTSYHDHQIVAANWSGGDRSADERVSTYAMFTDPPLAHVGIYEADARKLVAEAGRKISQATFHMRDVSRAKEESETFGLIKLLVDNESGHFLGASMLGLNADEIVQTIGQLMAAGGTVDSVRNALPIHPTVTEFFPTVLDRLQPLFP